MKKIKINLNNVDDIKRFIGITKEFDSDIDVISGSRVLDAKSILALYSLDLSKDIEVRIISDNVDERRMFDSMMERFS